MEQNTIAVERTLAKPHCPAEPSPARSPASHSVTTHRQPGEHGAGGTRAPAARGEDARSYNTVHRRGSSQTDRLNIHGGSLAIGHPFGATGARMVTTVANELARTGRETELLGICAAGGLGAGAVMERV